ncbi:hypothetical protein A2160_05910 [Candidatus Beckwithbacteria bacterium RBG_13_42_9]|uniref:Uncharacterized protein n=1 Tax=Candidatus Beckwithbacteria bacterium RBG_13_42_9 TaxID=1797457 RepID=A0A1F5E5A5_9BACT|nr:MAG: hypothetical protein A2160_05910 [Candidatus Beckwithbacteria bacterium RBG_13_42_9]
MDLTGLAIKQALKGNFEEAVKTNLEILQKEPQSVDSLNRLAQAYFHLGQIGKSLKAYRKVIQLDRFNPIAKRNLEKIKNSSHGLAGRWPKKRSFPTPLSSLNFVEEPGKTKLIALVCLGDVQALAELSVGQPLQFVTRGKVMICLYNEFKKYIGRLPDDLSRRLIWLMDRGNDYQAYVKSVGKNRVLVFLKEIKQAKINRNYPSFPSFQLKDKQITP